jgi:hypothetical protein
MGAIGYIAVNRSVKCAKAEGLAQNSQPTKIPLVISRVPLERSALIVFDKKRLQIPITTYHPKDLYLFLHQTVENQVIL